MIEQDLFYKVHCFGLFGSNFVFQFQSRRNCDSYTSNNVSILVACIGFDFYRKDLL